MIKGIGTDIVKHERVNLKLANKILTAVEYEQFTTINEINKIEFIASRFAAKEAIIKASNKQFICREIELTNTSSGQLITNIPGMHISISHEQDYSVAFALWEV